MESKKIFEEYPSSFVFISNIVQIFIYLIGVYIIYLFNPIAVFFYVFFILILEIRLLKKSCTNCYYYGKKCAFGKGKICHLFFNKGESDKFFKKISWLEIIPDFLVFIIPMTIGILMMMINFNFILLGLVIILFLFSSIVTGFIRGSLACKFCMQRYIGCPAEKLFSKKIKAN